jgi:general secretion pathway protein E
MLNFQEIHDTSLEAFATEGYEIALKNFVLLGQYEQKETLFISNANIDHSLDFLSKHKNNDNIICLDEISYDKLYNKYIELKTDRQMSDIASAQEDAVVEDDDISVAEFLKTSADIMTSEESAPIIKFVNSLFYQAIKKKASDIHIELHEFKGEVRYRLNGVLEKHIELDKKIMTLVVSRIKVISQLDISEKRVPQDGRTSIKLSGKTLDIRVSVLPTFYGERVVMRILMQSEDIPSLEDLGIHKDITTKLEDLTSASHGMVLVTGPTGSGKSTTLHALLQKIESRDKNIITVEDPVEYKSDSINQIQVNSKVGLTFAAGLRSILRQDPDIIMLGEIRDYETASIATQAALTGHLLFSTLHTNTAPAAVTRLIDMGLERFLISSSLLGVLAQRLVRTLCYECKIEDILAEHHIKQFALSANIKAFKSVGCKACNFTGYKKRIAVAELFIINDEIKMSLKDDIDDSTLEHLALKSGMKSIKSQLKDMIKDGQTSLEEAVRIGLH